MTPTGPSLPISVVLPTHNRRDVLPRAIRSVLAQTAPPAELIVVDDGSTEDIAGLIAAMGDPRLRYLRLDTRSGPGAARNAGARAATADWVAFQDSDDEWFLNKLELQWERAEHGTTKAALICGSYVIASTGRAPELIACTPEMRERFWTSHTLFCFPFIAPTWLLRRTQFLEAGEFDVSLPSLEDWEMAFRLHSLGGFATIEHPLLLKHGSEDGLNKDPVAQAASLRRIRDTHGALWHDQRAVNGELARRLGRQLLRAGDYLSARRELGRALRAKPSARTAALWLSACAGGRGFEGMQRIARRRRKS